MAIPKIDDQDINTMPRCDIEELKSQVKHLKDLLKECRPYVDQAMSISFNDNDIGWKPWQINRCTILTKIDNAIGASKND